MSYELPQPVEPIPLPLTFRADAGGVKNGKDYVETTARLGEVNALLKQEYAEVDGVLNDQYFIALRGVGMLSVDATTVKEFEDRSGHNMSGNLYVTTSKRAQPEPSPLIYSEVKSIPVDVTILRPIAIRKITSGLLRGSQKHVPVAAIIKRHPEVLDPNL